MCFQSEFLGSNSAPENSCWPTMSKAKALCVIFKDHSKKGFRAKCNNPECLHTQATKGCVSEAEAWTWLADEHNADDENEG